MKLHLPLSLRSALLSMLTMVSSLHAAHYDVTYDEQLGKREYEDLDLTIYVTLTMDSLSTKLVGTLTNLTVHGTIEMKRGYIAYSDESGSIASATIRLRDGGYGRGQLLMSS